MRIAKYYKAYQERLLRLNYTDFDDLLLLTLQILQNDENFAKEMSAKYRYIMVDEYQDTNELQYQILRKLCLAHENIAVVGDDDQSIYAWRGAKIENILNFQKQFKNVKLVKLEQNYRSTSAILNAANALISNNKKRLGKTLISTKNEGEAVEILNYYDEKEESDDIAFRVQNLLNSGIRADEIAILYRVNALSRALEEALMRAKIPFKILSGMRFYERAEIKDIIAYLRFLLNLNDDFSLKRIINKPKRAFGDTSLKKLELKAKELNLSLFDTLCAMQGSGFFSVKIDREMSKFTQILQELSHIDDVSELLNEFEAKIGLKNFYKESTDGDERVRNIDEFYANVKERVQSGQINSLQDLLNEISLQSDQDGLNGECVFLMSIHASKGLEFECVFIVGLENGFFPLLGGDSYIEEERRLAYVAITRAKKQLFLSHCHSRFHRGYREYDLQESKFLNEIKGENLAQNESFKKGDLIKHEIFGIGRVKSVEDENICVIFGGSERILRAKSLEKVGEF